MSVVVALGNDHDDVIVVCITTTAREFLERTNSFRARFDAVLDDLRFHCSTLTDAPAPTYYLTCYWPNEWKELIQ